MRKPIALIISVVIIKCSFAQLSDTTIFVNNADSSLRIINLNPYFTQHVDSNLSYQFQINRDQSKYFWYLKNSPVGLKINKDNGLLTFKAEKSYFLSGKLKYDVPYKVFVGVQSLINPEDKTDTSFTLVFFNTDIIASKLKPTVASTLYVDEGETISFKVQCESGSFPIEDIIFTSSIPIKNFSLVTKCNDEFTWTPDYDFVKKDSAAVNLSFIGSTKFKSHDTANVRIVVRDAINYPLANSEYNQA